MASLSDSRWVTDDVLASALTGVPQTITQSVSAYSTDVNDPDLSGWMLPPGPT
jgi:hypothetical protein